MVRLNNDEFSTKLFIDLILKKNYYKLYIGFGIFFTLSHVHKNCVSVYDKKKRIILSYTQKNQCGMMKHPVDLCSIFFATERTCTGLLSSYAFHSEWNAVRLSNYY